MSIAKLRYFILLVFLGVTIPLAVVGWSDLYRKVLEGESPQVILSPLRGINLGMSDLMITVRDGSSGISKLQLVQKQGEKSRVLFKNDEMQKASSAQFLLSYPGLFAGLEQMMLRINVYAQDAGYRKNNTAINYDIPVDYTKPYLEPLLFDQTISEGGTELLFYKAADEALAESGIQIGTTVFRGFPAKMIDGEFQIDNLYGVFYTYPMDGLKGQSSNKIQLYADDRVGNTSLITLPITVQERTQQHRQKDVSRIYMIEESSRIYEQNRKRIKEYYTDAELQKQYDDWERTNSAIKNISEGDKKLLKEFFITHKVLPGIDKAQVSSQFPEYRYDSYWFGRFLRQAGRIDAEFGSNISWRFLNLDLLSIRQESTSIVLPSDQRDVLAAGDGIVIFSDSIGMYGRCLAFDHGMGIATMYSHLDTVSVRQGQYIKAGEVIASASKYPEMSNSYFSFQILIQGVPVNIEEWWDDDWFGKKIISKVNTLKKNLGLPIRF
jgi:murein DD-endopeptidase MepM/ murein hydrolase activator NlpD